MTPKKIKEVLDKHARWLKGEGAERADLARAELARVDLAGAEFNEANLARADLARANLYGANLARANLNGVRISWINHGLLSEILWRAADTVHRQMLTAFVGRKTDWFWDDWAKFRHKEKTWALRELAKWIHQDDTEEAVPPLVWKYRKKGK